MTSFLRCVLEEDRSVEYDPRATIHFPCSSNRLLTNRFLIKMYTGCDKIGLNTTEMKNWRNFAPRDF